MNAAVFNYQLGDPVVVIDQRMADVVPHLGIVKSKSRITSAATLKSDHDESTMAHTRAVIGILAVYDQVLYIDI